MNLRRLAAVAVALALLLPALVWRPGAAAPDAGWWDSAWAYRVAIDISAAGFARDDTAADVAVNFTDLLEQVGEGSRFDPDSIRVLEVEGTAILDEAVPFQFDQAADYNPSSNASGTLVILLTGATAADETRRYHVYFDVVGSDHTEAEFANRVTVGSVTDAYGYDAHRIRNDDGTYYYHKTGGGFSSLLDGDNKDWIGWNPAPRGAGDYRGIPNMVHPNDGGYFHPGRANVTTSLARRGPVKVTIRSTSRDGQWATQWEVYPAYVRLTVLKTASDKSYWLLYEGTPGGRLDLNTDVVVRSDGATTPAGESWLGDLVGEEWVYFADPVVGRALYAVLHDENEVIDSYTPDDLKAMTIFGFGRNVNARQLSGAGRQMTIGLVNETEVAAVGAAIHAAYKPLDIAFGQTQQRPATPTPTPSPTDEPTNTPRPTRTPTPTDEPTETPLPADTPTPTPTATQTPQATATATLPPTPGPSPTPTRKPVAVWYLPTIIR